MLRHTLQKGLILVFLVMIGATSVMGQSKVGTTGAPFLGISVGARGTAMGGAFSAVSTDVTALYYNPGGIPFIGKSQFMACHTSWLVGSKFNWVGLMLNLDGNNVIGIHFTQLDYGDEEVTTVLIPEGTGETWGASDIAVGLSYGRKLTDQFSIGGNAKYIQQSIWNESARAFALDVGLLFITNFHDMRLGMSISNFGTDLKMDGRDLLQRVDLDPEAMGNNETIVAELKTENWPLPFFFRVGLAMDVLHFGNSRVTLAMDALRPSDNTEIINLGTEISFNDWVFLRGGYKSLFRDDSEEGLTVGGGVHIAMQDMFAIEIDYTYADFGLFEHVQMISGSVTF